MTKQIAKRRQGAGATSNGASVQVRLQPDMLEALDTWIDQQPGPTTRPQALRVLAAIGLLAEMNKKSAKTLDEKVAAAKRTIAENQPQGKPSPGQGMKTLRRGLAENDLRNLKAEKGKATRGVESSSDSRSSRPQARGSGRK